MATAPLPHKKIVCFNGPPGSGKDTAVNRLWTTRMNVGKLKMSQPIKNALANMLMLRPNTVKELEASVAAKETIHHYLMGQTWRQLQIDFSEKYLKPCYGSAVFGLLALQRLQNDYTYYPTIAISDAGFADELVPLASWVGKGNFLIVQLHRQGHDFSNDSRGYVTLPNVKTIHIYNDHSLDVFHKMIDDVVGAWLDGVDNGED